MSHGHSLPTTGVLHGGLGLSTDGLLSGPSGLAVASIDPGVVGDDGGWLVTATGAFPLVQGVLFRVRDGGSLDALCYSGVVGNEEYSDSADGVAIQFVVPPLPVGGPYDIYSESEDGLLTHTAAALLTVVHRSFTTNLYELRAQMPPPRDVGSYRVENED